jgi:hypothetical protein
LIVFSALAWMQEQEPPAASAPKDHLFAEIASLSGFLYELAAERYAAHSNRNETWFLTVHQGRNLRKWTDGRFTLLSLPALDKRDRIAKCRYAAQYNAFNLQAADRLVKAGKYAEAEELYCLVLYFDRCGDDIMREQTNTKLTVLEKLKKGEDRESNLKRFEELCDELAPLVDFSQVEKLAPTVVTNIMTVRLPQ